MENLYVFAVVPHAGTWIEIVCRDKVENLKFVVPHAGTWIEIKSIAGTIQNAGSRSPRGNVD